MLIPTATLRRIAAGEVDLAYRRWASPRVKPGTRLRTAAGLVEVVSIAEVALRRIDDRDARRAGHADREELLDRLRSRRGRVFRIELRPAGEDPRVALRRRARFSAGEAEELERRLATIDRRSRQPWTRRTLELIRDHPGVRAAELAAAAGSETRPFKARVRRLNELGLTESLKVGYRLSPRGAAWLQRSGRGGSG